MPGLLRWLVVAMWSAMLIEQFNCQFNQSNITSQVSSTFPSVQSSQFEAIQT
jgi:hypothetical protein